jgi:hypothetical protein
MIDARRGCEARHAATLCQIKIILGTDGIANATCALHLRAAFQPKNQLPANAMLFGNGARERAGHLVDVHEPSVDGFPFRLQGLNERLMHTASAQARTKRAVGEEWPA